MTAASKMASEEDECPACGHQVYQAEAYLAGSTFSYGIIGSDCALDYIGTYIILN